MCCPCDYGCRRSAGKTYISASHLRFLRSSACRRFCSRRSNLKSFISSRVTNFADLQAQKSQIELERGRQITKQQILAFVAELIKGEPTDKEYQRKIIDNLVFMVYVYDNEIVTYLNFGVDKAIERVRLDETNAAIEGLKNVQTLSPLLHHQLATKKMSP